MQKLLVKLQRPRTFFLLILFLFMLGMYSARWDSTSGTVASYANKQQITTSPLRIENKTSSLGIAAVDRQGSLVRLILKNNSSKAITAFVIGRNGKRSYTRTELDPDNPILPGATRIEEFPLLNQAATGGQAVSQDNVITILALVFDDKNSEGDAKIIREIMDARSGEKEQSGRIYHLLQGISSSGNAAVQSLEVLKARVKELPDNPEVGASHAYRAAFKDAKEYALRKIKQLEEMQEQGGDPSFNRGLSHLLEKYRKKLEKL